MWNKTWQICDRMFRRVLLVKSRLKEIKRQREDYIQCAPWMSLLARVAQCEVVTAVTAMTNEETRLRARKPSSQVTKETKKHTQNKTKRLLHMQKVLGSSPMEPLVYSISLVESPRGMNKVICLFNMF